MKKKLITICITVGVDDMAGDTTVLTLGEELAQFIEQDNRVIVASVEEIEDGE